MKEYAKKFYKSKRWQNCRNSYFKKCGGLCERCLKKGQIVPGEIVHHKTYITENNINNPNITLNFDNLELLCRECHKEEHKEDKKKSKLAMLLDSMENEKKNEEQNKEKNNKKKKSGKNNKNSKKEDIKK
jgi:5-methylcytosine-specific restriction endonuclease McrA